MPETPTLSIEEATAAITAPGQMFEMEEVDIRGVPTRVWKNCPASLRVVLELSRGHGDTDYLVYEDERTTYEEHFRIAASIAHGLHDRFGVERGDRVAIAMRNLPEWAMAFWGAAAAGGVVVPLNAWWTSPELHYGLSDSGTTVAFVDAARLERLAPHLAELPDLQAVVVTHEDRVDEPVLPGSAVPVVSFAELVGSPDPAIALPNVVIEPDDDATIFYTSGTTGKPKGAVGTHRNMGTNLMSLFFLNTRAGLRAPKQTAPGDDEPGRPGAHLLSVPLFHATGCHSILVANDRGGQQARDDAPLGSRARPGAHRARAHRDLRRGPGHGDAGHRLPRVRDARHVIGAGRGLRRRPRTARPRAPH